jgi:hypothetical protein
MLELLKPIKLKYIFTKLILLIVPHSFISYAIIFQQ